MADEFVIGNQLPQRWHGRERFVVLAAGPGAASTFLSIWRAWREDPTHCERLVVIAVEPDPLSLGVEPAVQPQANEPEATEPATTTPDSITAGQAPPGLAAPDLAQTLRRAWPPATTNLHRLAFEDGRVELLLALGTGVPWWREIAAQVDAFCLEADAPDDAKRQCQAVGRMASTGATLVAAATNPAASAALRQHLGSAGFSLQPATPRSGEAEWIHARFEPAFVPRRAPVHAASDVGRDRHAVIVGAGLAGCAAAWALAAQGWRSTVLERRPQVAEAASGNPAGLFHGIVNAQDGLHARFNRAAALAAQAAIRDALQRGVPGSVDGLLRLETSLEAPDMCALLRELGLPPDYVQALDAAAASLQAGIALPGPAWFYPGGGWVDPSALARDFLGCAGGRVELRTGTAAARLVQVDGGWRVLDAGGSVIAEAGTVVLANAGAALDLIEPPGWPIDSVRGQISIARSTRLAAPGVPVAGSGYLLPAIEGRVVFGATAQAGDTDPSVRGADHVLNLKRLEGLLGRQLDLDAADLEGRTAWRCSAVDRLPLIGAVPDLQAGGTRLDQPRFVPRLPGLYVFSALGSRGITWSVLGARVLAAWVSQAPMPLEASLRDAIDPARFVSRRMRRAMRG